jgi:2-dehydro-3-deoxyphosphooctonate aldolase (KDO 8-P synthase)
VRIPIDQVTAFERGRLGIIAGPCVAESPALCLEVAVELARIARELALPLVFKTSYAKANRTSSGSYSGPGLEPGLEILEQVRSRTGLPVLADVHEAAEVPIAARVLQVLQIPAFLCRQTPLLTAAGASGLPVNVKKGQFMAPASMQGAVDKLRAAGCPGVMLTERGTTFGYNDLVVDMRSFAIMRETGALTVFDMTHSLQQPGGAVTGGERAHAEPLARAALAAGADCLFLETHPEPATARSDAATQLPLAEVGGLLGRLARFRAELVATATAASPVLGGTQVEP